MKSISIYTDGACSGNPGPGGWAGILIYMSTEKEISGGEALTTNNRMELTAAIKSLELLKEACNVTLYSDSAYLCNAFNECWVYNWLKNEWKTSKKEAVENQDLWKDLLRLSDYHKISWVKVKGHTDNEYNNRCDKLARDAIKC